MIVPQNHQTTRLETTNLATTQRLKISYQDKYEAPKLNLSYHYKWMFPQKRKGRVKLAFPLFL
jgi:hypothetical protein